MYVGDTGSAADERRPVHSIVVSCSLSLIYVPTITFAYYFHKFLIVVHHQLFWKVLLHYSN